MGSGITLACTGRPKAGGANVGDNETSGVARVLWPVKPALYFFRQSIPAVIFAENQTWFLSPARLMFSIRQTGG